MDEWKTLIINYRDGQSITWLWLWEREIDKERKSEITVKVRTIAALLKQWKNYSEE